MINQIEYRVVHHIQGRIRLHVPAIKKLPMETLKKLSTLPAPEGIRNVQANPITGSVVINYDPKHIDITKFLQEMMADEEFLATIGMK